MRKIERIDDFCSRLALAWKNVPDLRFGQFMCIVLGEFAYQTGKDPFFPEEDEMIAFIEKYTDEHSIWKQEV